MIKVNIWANRLLCLAIITLTLSAYAGIAAHALGIRDEEVNEFDHEYVQPPSPPPIVTIDVEVRKVWVATGEHPESVLVQLYRTRSGGGTRIAYGVPEILDDSNGWHKKWTGLAENCIWTVEEINVPEGYEAIITGNAANGFTITNREEPPPTPPPPPPETNNPETQLPPTTTPPPIQTPEPPGDGGHGIFDPNIPGGGLDAPGGTEAPPGSIPRTGDETDPSLWLLVLALSATALRYMLFFRKNKNNEQRRGHNEK